MRSDCQYPRCVTQVQCRDVCLAPVWARLDAPAPDQPELDFDTGREVVAVSPSAAVA